MNYLIPVVVLSIAIIGPTYAESEEIKKDVYDLVNLAEDQKIQAEKLRDKEVDEARQDSKRADQKVRDDKVESNRIRDKAADKARDDKNRS